MPTCGSTHTGGGLFDIGAMLAGYEPLWGVEIRPDIADWAEINTGMTVIRSDVALVDYASLPTVDHLHSSPSCQSASVANKSGSESPEDISSARAICRALRQIRPQTFTLENVYQYRTFDSFKMIVTCLRKCGYHVDWWYLNFANYGVAQTRKRLILIARLDRQPRKPQPTHSRTSDMFGLYKPWVGWLESITDILHTLPESEFAPWQAAGLPEEYKTMLLAQGGFDGQVVSRLESEPAFTITANGNQSGLKAFLMPGGGNTNFAEAKRCRYEDEPSMTVTVRGNYPRAFVAGSHYGRSNLVADRTPQIRNGDEPYFTVTVSGGVHNDARAFVGRVVQMTPRALARFQSVPDSYRLPDANGLACKIIGNGVSCLMSKVIMESLQ